MRLAEEITSFMNALKSLTGIGICYYDLNDFFNYNEYGVQSNRGHYCRFCENARALPGGRSYCEKSDKSQAVDLAMQYKEPFFYECHMGMRELLVPIVRDDILIGIIFIGQCRLDTNYDAQIAANAKKMNADHEYFLSLYNELPEFSQNELINIGKIINQYFDSLLLGNELLSAKLTPSSLNLGVAESIKNYIQRNYKYPLILSDIADNFHINPSYASRVFSKKYGITITEYLTGIRIDRAKQFLTTTNIPIGNIALNVGYNDQNYFSRIFKSSVGMSPGKYRKDSNSPSSVIGCK